MEDWVEWEEAVLRTALNAGQVSSVLAHLDAAVQGKEFLAGEGLSLADVAVLATLTAAVRPCLLLADVAILAIVAITPLLKPVLWRAVHGG